MGSKAGRIVVNWRKTEDRIYLVGLAYAFFMMGFREKQMIPIIKKMIPDWKRVFDGDHVPTDHALFDRADKADRNEEQPTDDRGIEIWNQANRDAMKRKCTWEFAWRKKPLTPTKQVVTISPTAEIVELRILR